MTSSQKYNTNHVFFYYYYYQTIDLTQHYTVYSIYKKKKHFILSLNSRCIIYIYIRHSQYEIVRNIKTKGIALFYTLVYLIFTYSFNFIV